MSAYFFDSTQNQDRPVIPVYLLSQAENAIDELPDDIRKWITTTEFVAKSGKNLLVSDSNGALKSVVLGIGTQKDPFVVGVLPDILPDGIYRLNYSANSARDRFQDALAWGLGTYRFDRYKTARAHRARLQLDPAIDQTKELIAILRAISLGRDLITTPANDMGPAEINEAAKALSQQYGAHHHCVVGEDLVAKNFPLVHEVGQASTRAPHLIELTWGQKEHPKITLVGKGVAFDSGGLNIKPGSAMALMKKDMGGAACVLALASIIMETELPINLRVIIPAVDNAISGSAFRPGDVLTSRSGRTVEIGNTDAEGRLILADALTLACEGQPELIIDMATLTGAARVALGTEIPALFSSDFECGHTLQTTSMKVSDPLWHMPLWQPYRQQLDSKIADINHISSGSYGGAITAALFMSDFITDNTKWMHIDLMAYNTTARPGRPVGGEAQGVRALYAYLKTLYGA